MGKCGSFSLCIALLVVGARVLWGDVGVCMGLAVGRGGSLDCVIVLGFGDEVVGHHLVALGIILLANGAVVGLGRIGLSLGMVGASLDG